MTDDELQMKFFELLQGTEVGQAIKELDSVWNLNNDPLATRRAGLKAARLSFVMGFRFAEHQTKL